MSGPERGGAEGLTRAPIPTLVRRLALPSATAMALQTVFNVTNSYWAASWSTEALAAVATAFPIFFVIIAASFGFGQGTAALLAHALGAGDTGEARRLWGQALLLAAFAGLVVALAGSAGAPILAALLGARDAVREQVVAYIVPLLAAGPLFLLAAVSNAALTAHGDTRSLRDAVAAATLVNAGLVPLLMFGAGPLPPLGVVGIAASHLAVQTGQLAWLGWRAARTGLARGLSLRDVLPRPALASRVLRQVVPNTVTMMATGVGLAIVTAFAARHGPAAVAAYGVALRIEQLVLLPTLGLNAATVALVGRNLGAGKPDRVVESVRFALAIGVGLMSAGALLVYLARSPLLALFTDDPLVREFGVLYLGIVVLAFPAYAVVILGAGVLQGLRRPLPALLVGAGRHIVAPPLVVWSLDVALGLGFSGLALAVPLISWAGAFATGGLIRRYLPRPAASAGVRG